MNATDLRRTAIGLGTLAALSLSGCGDKRIDNLSRGIPRDSALKVLAGGPTGDSLANVYKQETYLYNSHLINVLLYNKEGLTEKAASVPDKELTPVVLIDNKVSGWGWQHYDSVAKANNIPVKPHD